MTKFVRSTRGASGRPRTNKGDKSGTVRVVVLMPGAEGNISRTLSIADAKVSEVFRAIAENLTKQPV